MPAVAASCTTDQTTFQKCRRQKFMVWILSKKVQIRFFNGLCKNFSCPGSGHAPRPTSQTPGTRPVPCPVPCRTPHVWRTWSWDHWLPGHDQCLTLPPAAPPTRQLFKNVAEKNLWYGSYRKKFKLGFSTGWVKNFHVRGRATPHAPHPRPQGHGPCHAPCHAARPTCGARGRGTTGSQAMTSA